MSFGKMPPANGFLEKKDFKNEIFYDMEVGFSEKISLFQLNKFSNPKIIHSANYPFYTSSSEYMKTHFKNFSQHVLENVGKDPFIVEIGSNDGIMLQNFAKRNIRHLGVEPSKNVAEVAKKIHAETYVNVQGDEPIVNPSNIKKIINYSASGILN